MNQTLLSGDCFDLHLELVSDVSVQLPSKTPKPLRLLLRQQPPSSNSAVNNKPCHNWSTIEKWFHNHIQMLGCTSPAWSSMSLCLNRVSAAFRPSLAPWLAAYFTSLRDSSKAGWDIQLPCLVIYCLICALSGCHLSICGGQHTRDQSRCDSTVFYTSACSVPSLLKCIHHGLPGSRRCSVP